MMVVIPASSLHYFGNARFIDQSDPPEIPGDTSCHCK